MQGTVRFASASFSLLFTGLLMGGLVFLGGAMLAPAPVSERTFSAFAIPLGSETGEAEQQQAQPQPAAPAPPQVQQAAVNPAAPPVLPIPAILPAAPAIPAPAASTPPAPVAVSAPASAAPAAAAASTSAAAPPSAAPKKGARDGFDSNAPAGTSRSYAAKVRSWLYAHKSYPKRSRMRHEEGIVRVRFVLDRQGRLLEGRVVAGSGFSALDQEGEAMLTRASPYPAAPQDISGERIEFTAPIEFALPS